MELPGQTKTLSRGRPASSPASSSARWSVSRESVEAVLGAFVDQWACGRVLACLEHA